MQSRERRRDMSTLVMHKGNGTPKTPEDVVKLVKENSLYFDV